MKVFAALLLAAAATVATAPRTRVSDVKETLHGVTIADPYRWLEDQESPETRSWIEQQNRYTQSLLQGVAGRDRVKARLTALMKVDRTGMPVARGGRYFFTRRLANQDQGVLYMREGLRGNDMALVDPNPMSPDKTTSVSLFEVSEDGSLIVYGLRRGGEDEVALKLMQATTRENLKDELPRARYEAVSMKPDRSGFYYSRYTKEGTRVFYHEIGKDSSADPEIFGHGYPPEKDVAAEVSENGRYVLYSVSEGWDRNELYYQNLAAKDGIRPLVRGVKARFNGEFGGDTLFVQTDWKAPNGRIVAVDMADPAPEKWRDVVPETKSVLESFSAAGGRLFANYLEDVNSRVKVFEPDGRYVSEISFPAMGTVSGVGGWWTSHEAFFLFNSFHIPETIYRYDTASGEQAVWTRAKIPVDSDSLELKQVWYASKDGTRIPMFLLYKRGVKQDGARPTLLTGYGGFNVSLTPHFSASAVLWAEMGGVFAQPNMRGGGEFGEPWHQGGMREKKQNVFDDFIAAAVWLTGHGYASPSKLAIEGGSNGGLLVGAAITQRPDLFQAAVCAYPLLDMLRFQRFLVARWWVPEYGSSDDPAQFKYLYAYSPYHHVKAGVKYPAVMFVTGDGDTRVAPLHARKMAALMQASTGSERPILLHYDVKAGHSAGMPVTKQIDDTGDELTFLLWQLQALN